MHIGNKNWTKIGNGVKLYDFFDVLENLLQYFILFYKSDGDVDIRRGKEGGNLMASQIQSAAQPDSLHA